MTSMMITKSRYRMARRQRFTPYGLLLAVAQALALGSAFGTAAAAQPPTVVELYTSEGCSSCPPAEALLEKLASRPDVLPLAFHVNYWDGLGWRDRFSLPEATARQQTMARLLRLSTVGTPQFIVGGRRAVWGANAMAVETALSASPAAIDVGVERRGNELHVRILGSAPPEPYDAYVVGILPKAVTAIQRGENAGRTLTEINVVRSIQKIDRSRDSAHEWHVPLERLPKDAERVAVLIQSSASGAILGARLAP